MKNRKSIFRSIFYLLLPIALYSCQGHLLHESENAKNPALIKEQVPGSLNPETCATPRIYNLTQHSSCNRVDPCSNQIVQLGMSMNEIRWKVGDNCGNATYNTINGTPRYKLFGYVSTTGTCEYFNEVASFSCNNTTMRATMAVLLNNKRFVLAVSNAPIPVTSVYKNTSTGIFYGNSCTGTTWGISSHVEFTTGAGAGIQCNSKI